MSFYPEAHMELFPKLIVSETLHLEQRIFRIVKFGFFFRSAYAEWYRSAYGFPKLFALRVLHLGLRFLGW